MEDFTAKAQRSRRGAKKRRFSEAGGRSFGGKGRDGALTLVGVFDFVGFRVFLGPLDRRVYRGQRALRNAEEDRG